MEVDRVAFPARLLDILEALSEAHFVSLDFEFSGVASKPQFRAKQTLQERYAETKQAAERYQILQVGLTCAIQDIETKSYTLHPYNFPLSPIYDEDLGIERIWSFQSGAVEFLLSHGFDFNRAFEVGVPYLSQDEELTAKAKFKTRNDKSRFEDILLPENDQLSVAFLEKVRKEINEWSGTEDYLDESIEIVSRTEHWKECSHNGDLTAFDRRLIHQLVRAEYPDHVSIGRRQSILIKRKDDERERDILKARYKKLKSAILRQKGFRWIIDALTGQSLLNLDIGWCASDPETGSPKFYNDVKMKAIFDRAADKLKRKRPILVGHNMFTDLVYLYQAFIGSLPETVGEFRLRIHDNFPKIVDTKYLATYNCGNLNPASSLSEIAEALSVQFTPKIELHKNHDKYRTEEMLHEAGYDSYLTARIMILLSAKLEAAGTYVLEEHSTTSVTSTPTPLTAPKEANPNTTLVTQLLKAQTTPPPKTTSRFATATMFDALASLSPQDGPMTEGPPVTGSSFTFDPTARPFPISATGDGAFDSGNGTAGIGLASPKTEDMGEKAERKVKDRPLDSLMPPFESDFWRIYANKLRVFGTAEGMLDLDPMRTTV